MTERLLFGPNNHSAWQINYRAVDAEREALVRQIIKSHYAHLADAVVAVAQVDEAEVNSNNFKITVHKGGEAAMYLLRRVSRSRARAEVERSCELMRTLQEGGAALPVVRESQAASAVVESDNAWWTLYDFIDGNHYRGTDEELVDLAEKVGAFDAQLASLSGFYEKDPSLHFTPEYVEKQRFSRGVWEAIFSKIGVLVEKEGEDSFGRKVLEAREEIEEALEWLLVQQAPTQRPQLMHFDLHPHNFLADGKRILAILDLDALRYVEKMRALSFALHRAARQNVVCKAPADSAAALKNAAQRFVEHYRKHSELTEAELATVAYFIKHESFHRLTTTIKQYADSGVLLWKTDLEKQLVNIKEAEYFA